MSTLLGDIQSDLLKNETGKNGKEHIQLRVIEQAKGRLVSTTVSASEIV